MKKTLKELIEAGIFPIQCDFSGSQRVLIGFNLVGLIVVENPDGSYGLIQLDRILTDYVLPKQEPRIASPAFVKTVAGRWKLTQTLYASKKEVEDDLISSEIEWPAKYKNGSPIEYQIPNED